MTDLPDALRELTEQVRALREEIEAQTALAESIVAVNRREATRALADLLAREKQ